MMTTLGQFVDRYVGSRHGFRAICVGSLALGLHACTLTKPAVNSEASGNPVDTASSPQQPLPDLINCYVSDYKVEDNLSGYYSEEIASYYRTGKTPVPVFSAKKMEDLKYHVKLDVRNLKPERISSTRDEILRQAINSLRSSKYKGVWSGDLQDTKKYCDPSHIIGSFDSPFWEYENKYFKFKASSGLLRGILSDSGGISFTRKSDPKAAASFGDDAFLNTNCLVYSREIPAPFSKVFLNGDRRFSMQVEGLVAGASKQPSEVAPNYLIVTRMDQTVIDYMKKRNRDADYIPVTNADGFVVGWLTHVAEDDFFKGLIETVHGPKFKDPRRWGHYFASRGPSRDDSRSSPVLTVHDDWKPDLASPAYQQLTSNCSLIVRLALASKWDLKPVADGLCRQKN